MPYFNSTYTLEDKFAIERRNKPSMLIADKVAPMVPVDINKKHYPIWGEEFLEPSPTMGVRAPSAAAENVDFTYTTDFYDCVERAFETKLDIREDENAQPEFRVKQHKVEIITDKQLLTRECLAAAALFNATTFASYYAALSGSDKWSNTSSNPQTQVNIAKDSIRLNGVVDPEQLDLAINNHTWQVLRDNPAIVAKTKYSTFQLLTTSVVAAALGLRNIFIGSGVKKVAGTKANIWGDYAFFFHSDEATSIEDVSVAKTFILRNKDMRIESYFLQQYSSWFWRSKWDYDIKVTAPSSAYLFGTVCI